MNCPCTSSASTNPPFPIRLRVLKHARLERPASMRFLYVASQVLARRWPATIVCWLNGHLRRLPSHGRLPFRSCPRLVFVSYELSIWYTDSCKKIGIKHRGLSSRLAAPHKLTPMLGVHERGVASSAFRQWKINRGHPVVANVIRHASLDTAQHGTL